MAKEVLLNAERPTYSIIVEHHAASTSALKFHYSQANPNYTGLTSDELSKLEEKAILHQERQDILSLLAFLESCFRVDYIQRKKNNLKDELSKALIKIFNRRHYRASLEDEIFRTWHKLGYLDPAINSHLHEAFHYRHWLAHGQYWESDKFRKRDFYELSSLVEGLINSKAFRY